MKAMDDEAIRNLLAQAENGNVYDGEKAAQAFRELLALRQAVLDRALAGN